MHRGDAALGGALPGGAGGASRRVTVFSADRRALTQVPERPPRDFFEAVQSLWLFWTFQRLAGNWSGLGRIDELLGPFSMPISKPGGSTSEKPAKSWPASGSRAPSGSRGRRVAGGDAQFYQNVILAGTGRDGREVCNRVTMLIFDIVEELHISDFPLGVRLSRKSPPPLLRRVAELQSRGGGIVSIYNEEVVIAALVKFGYPEKEACDFTNDGCWETLIPGETAFSYCPFDALQVWQDVFSPTAIIRTSNRCSRLIPPRSGGGSNRFAQAAPAVSTPRTGPRRRRCCRC